MMKLELLKGKGCNDSQQDGQGKSGQGGRRAAYLSIFENLSTTDAVAFDVQ